LPSQATCSEKRSWAWSVREFTVPAPSFSGDTTCFFGSGGSPSDIVRNAEVYRQNDINASLLFEFDGAGLTVRAKGFDRNGSELPESADTSPWSFPPAVFSQLASGADVTLFQGTSHEIRCTNLQVATDRLSAGDKFVINVAAAAKLDGLNTSPSLSGGFLSAANVAVEGDPFRVQSGEWGSSAQYRLADGAENGADLNLLGYFVDPLNGRSDVPGLGYYTGTLILQAEAAGFAPGSTVGAPDGTDAGSRRVRAEINPAIREIAAAEGIAVVDQHAVFLRRPDLLPEVHPVREGYRLMAEVWRDALRPRY